MLVSRASKLGVAVTLLAACTAPRAPTPAAEPPPIAPEVTAHAIAADTAHGVRGRVVDQNGVAVANAALWLLTTTNEAEQRPGASSCYLQVSDESRVISETQTDRDGRFAFDDAPAGRAWIGFTSDRAVTDPADAIAPIATAVEVTERGLDVELKAWRGQYVRGVVRNPDGSTASARSVVGLGRDVPGLAFTTSDASGTFALGPLGPGELQVWALGAPDLLDAPGVDAHANDAGVELVLAEGLHVAGRVIDADGQPVARAQVARFWMFDNDPSGVARGTLATDADGRFEGIDVDRTESSCLLAYSANRKLAGRVDVVASAGETPIEITLRPSVRVHGRFKSSALDRDVARTNMYWKAIDCGHPIAQCASKRAEFDVTLPIGRYGWHAYGMDVQGKSGEVELALGTPDVDLGVIELDAKFLALNRGKELPPWTVSDARGVALDRSQISDFRGKWLLVEFWGYW